MKRLIVCIIALTAGSSAWAQSSYFHDYKSFFGKEDRIGLFSEDAKNRYSDAIRQTITENTLLVNCGSKDKPASGFVVNTDEGQRIVTAAHNVHMAKENSRPCRTKKIGKDEVIIDDFKPSRHFKNSSTLLDAGFDVATSEYKFDAPGYNLCKAIDLVSELTVPQSYDGTGYLVLSPPCRATKISKHIITTDCRGHYKASGAPLLAIKDKKVCIAGVFNAHSGRLMNYESYAANMVLGN